MCGRFVAVTDPEGLARFFVVDDREADDLAPSYNVAPTDEVYAVVCHAGRRTLVTSRWGLLPSWGAGAPAGAPLINARAETAPAKPAFRDAFARRRCLVPADGFYEWRAGPGRTRTPYYVHRPDGRPLAFAGLWSTWRDPDDPAGPSVRTCVILTTASNERLAELHDRMPAIVPADCWDEWLDPDHPEPQRLRDLLVPAPDDELAHHPVSPRVNSPRHNDRQLLDPVPEQLRLG